MESRPLGGTGLSVSALGFGCGAVGGLMTHGDPAEQTRAVARALEVGITYFDTAASYGDGTSEENLGRVWRELRPKNAVVGTKFRVDGGDVGQIRRSLQESLRRLGFDRVDLLQLHNQVGPSDRSLTADFVLGPVVEELSRLKAEGLIGHFGFTATGDTPSIRRVIESGKLATAQVYFNALNPSAGFPGRGPEGSQDFDGIIDRAREAGVGVINIRSLAAGAVTGRDAADRPANAVNPGGTMGGVSYEGDRARASALFALAEGLGLEGPVELALRFALSKTGVSTVIVGYSNYEHLEDALRFAGRGPLSDEAVASVVALAGAGSTALR